MMAALFIILSFNSQQILELPKMVRGGIPAMHLEGLVPIGKFDDQFPLISKA